MWLLIGIIAFLNILLFFIVGLMDKSPFKESRKQIVERENEYGKYSISTCIDLDV